jgi:type IV pilus assembly protein PilC
MRLIRQIIEVAFWSLAAGVGIVGAAMIAGFVFAPAFGYFAAMAIIGLVPLALSVTRLVRRKRAAIVISYLEQAVRLNLPLPRMMRAASQSEHGTLAMRLMQLRQLLAEGYPVGAAIGLALPEAGDREVSMIAAAERVGQLPQTLRRLVREQSRDVIAEHERAANTGFLRAYPLVMVATMGSALSLFAVFVMPKYEQIFKDFGTRMPPVTQFTLNIMRDFGPPLAVLIVVWVLVASGRSLAQVIHPSGLHRNFLRHFRDTFAWFTPVRHGMERDRGLADAFELLAESTSASVPLSRAVLESAGLGQNIWLARKLRAWASYLEGGRSPADSARDAGMPAFVVGMLGRVGATGATAAADVFDFLGRYYRSRFSRTAAALAALSVPILVLLFGTCVALVALSVFTPLDSLIRGISSNAGHWVL